MNEIVVGYMGESGAETYATLSCHLDPAGNLVKTARQLYRRCETPQSAFPQSAEEQ